MKARSARPKQWPRPSQQRIRVSDGETIKSYNATLERFSKLPTTRSMKDLMRRIRAERDRLMRERSRHLEEVFHEESAREIEEASKPEGEQ